MERGCAEGRMLLFTIGVKRKLLKLVGRRRIVIAYNILKYSRVYTGVKIVI
jgi:hypothetical protein